MYSRPLLSPTPYGLFGRMRASILRVLGIDLNGTQFKEPGATIEMAFFANACL